MKKILCPTDFSETANNAIAYAAKLSQVMQADLTLFNVESFFDFRPEEIVGRSADTISRPQAQLEIQSRQVSSAFNISCYAEVETSYNKLSTAIQEKASSYDLIVMGTNGPDDLYQFFGGSNTYNAVMNTKTPLLLIPASVGYSEIRSVVYAFDYFRLRDLPLNGLKPFIAELKCDLKVLQVLEGAVSKDVDQDLKAIQYIIRTFHDDLNYEFNTIHSDVVAQSIHDFVLQNNADVLALCSVHQNIVERFFHKSTIKSLSRLCNYPLYIFHK